MMNLSDTAEELERKLSQRSAIDVNTEKFKSLFKGWAIDALCEIQYNAIEHISLQFEAAHKEYKSNAY